jgi:ferrochelatase
VRQPADHPLLPAPKIGVLLINLGTPNAPEPGAVKLYLREFLSDPRVVEIPQLVWQPILRGLILTTRPRKSAHAYRKVWLEEGSPLAVHMGRLTAALDGAFGPDVIVDHAMRYGRPAISERIDGLFAQGCTRLLVAPLYPQYCAATTATALDESFRHLRHMRWVPAVRTLEPYYDSPAYIEALAESLRGSLAALPFAPEAIVASFHGMPRRTLDLGDPYYCHCLKTARLLSRALGRELRVSFQSRFGRAKWLEPATDQVLAALPGEGVRKVAVVAPGFAVDCLETLEELDIRGRATFLDAGGTDFAYLPCLNDSPPGLEMLRQLIGRALEGWWSAQ